MQKKQGENAFQTFCMSVICTYTCSRAYTHNRHATEPQLLLCHHQYFTSLQHV